MITDTYSLYITLNGVDTKVDAEFSGFSIKELMHNGLKAADNSASITMVHDTAVENLLRGIGLEGVKAYILKGEERIFTGYIRRSFTFENNGNVKNTKLELVSPSFTLKRNIKSRYEAVGKTVTAIIEELLTLAGFDLTSASIPAITTVLPYMAIEEDEKTYYDVLNTLYYEYGYVLDFDRSGNIMYYTWIDTGSTTENEFNSTNILGSLKQTVKEESYQSINITWDSVKTLEDVNVFADTTGATGAYQCSVDVEDGKYFGVSDDDTATGLYCELSVDGYDLEYATGCELDYSTKSLSGNLSLKEFTPYGTKCWLSLKNESGIKSVVTKLNITASSAIVKVATNVSKVKSSDSAFANTMDYTAQYLFDQTNGDRLAADLRTYYEYADYTYSLNSKVDLACGELVNVNDPETGSVLCRVISRTTNEQTGVISYELEGVGEYTPAVVSEKTQVSSTADVTSIVKIAAVQEEVDTLSNTVTEVTKITSVYAGAINDVDDIPTEPTANEFFTWTGEETVLTEDLTLEPAMVYCYDAETGTWGVDNGESHIMTALSDICSVVDISDNTTAVQLVSRLIATNAFITNLQAQKIIFNQYVGATQGEVDDTQLIYMGKDPTDDSAENYEFGIKRWNGYKWISGLETEVDDNKNLNLEVSGFLTGNKGVKNPSTHNFALVEDGLDDVIKNIAVNDTGSVELYSTELTRIFFGNNIFIKLVRPSSSVYTCDEYVSSDGIDWTKVETLSFSPIMPSICFDGSYFWRFLNNDIYKSSDGINWTLVHSLSSSIAKIATFASIAYGNGIILTNVSASFDGGLTWEDYNEWGRDIIYDEQSKNFIMRSVNLEDSKNEFLYFYDTEKDSSYNFSSPVLWNKIGLSPVHYVIYGKKVLCLCYVQSLASDGSYDFSWYIAELQDADLSNSDERSSDKWIYWSLGKTINLPSTTNLADLFYNSSMFLYKNNIYVSFYEGTSSSYSWCLLKNQINSVNDEFAQELKHLIGAADKIPVKDSTNLITSGAVARCVNYSTSEVDTGRTWVDGKTIYKRSINLSGSFSAGASVQVSSVLKNSYVNQIIRLDGTYKDSTNVWMPVPCGNPSSMTNNTEWYVNANGLYFGFGTGRAPRQICCTVEYTKA